jgi:hypothetical protein
MMMIPKLITHEDYYGSVDINDDDGWLCGHLLFIDDEVTYEGENLDALVENFQHVVECYAGRN